MARKEEDEQPEVLLDRILTVCKKHNHDVRIRIKVDERGRGELSVYTRNNEAEELSWQEYRLRQAGAHR